MIAPCLQGGRALSWKWPSERNDTSVPSLNSKFSECYLRARARVRACLRPIITVSIASNSVFTLRAQRPNTINHNDYPSKEQEYE